MGQLHRGATESGVKYLRSGIEELMEQDLLFDFYLRNRRQCQSLGAVYPGIGGFRLEFGVEQDDQQQMALEQGAGAGQLKGLGVQV